MLPIHKTLCALSGIIVFATSAISEQITVRDCSNLVRASSNMPEGSSAAIHIIHNSGEKVNLKDSKGAIADVINPSESKNNQSLFTNIKAGDWTACGSDIDSVKFAFNNSQNSSGGVTLLAAGTGVLAGASVIAFGNQGGSSGNTIAESLENGADSENVAATSSNPSATAATSSDAATRCLNDSNVADMSQSD